jgi:hypothetical protein
MLWTSCSDFALFFWRQIFVFSHEAVQCIWRAIPDSLLRCDTKFRRPEVCRDFRRKIRNFRTSMSLVDQLSVFQVSTCVTPRPQLLTQQEGNLLNTILSFKHIKLSYFQVEQNCQVFIIKKNSICCQDSIDKGNVFRIFLKLEVFYYLN